MSAFATSFIRPSLRRHRRGFTLIEVLVVVAIIALLVSILLPALASARRQTRNVVCGTNLSSIGKAASMYSQGNRGVVLRGYWYQSLMLLPERLAPMLGGPRSPLVSRMEDPVITGAGSPSDRDKYLAPVFAKMQVLQCPSCPPTTKSPVTCPKGAVITEQPYDYVTNDFDFDKGRASKRETSTAGGRVTMMERVPSPSRLVHVTEASQNRDLAFFGKHDCYDPEIHLWWGTDPRMITDDRHGTGAGRSAGKNFSGRANCLFFDGHQESRLITGIRVSDFTPYLSPALYHP